MCLLDYQEGNKPEHSQSRSDLDRPRAASQKADHTWLQCEPCSWVRLRLAHIPSTTRPLPLKLAQMQRHKMAPHLKEKLMWERVMLSPKCVHSPVFVFSSPEDGPWKISNNHKRTISDRRSRSAALKGLCGAALVRSTSATFRSASTNPSLEPN